MEEDEGGHRRSEGQPPPRSPHPIFSVSWEETEGAKRIERMGREVSGSPKVEAEALVYIWWIGFR